MIKNKLIKTMMLTLLCSSFVSAGDAGCYNGNVLSGKLITEFCWSCIFPLKVAGLTLASGESPPPVKASSKPVCMCFDELGMPRPGITTSMWEPSRLIEFERVPGCLSSLGGARIGVNRLFQGHHSNAEFDGNDNSFMHYHYYSFPLLIIMDMFYKQSCNTDNYIDFDLMYLSELDPTWNNDELAFFSSPEAAIVAGPIAAVSCSTDAIASTAGKPIDEMFWCAGSWGFLYPFSGNQNGGKGVLRDSSLLSTKVLAALHRRGLAHETMGDANLCSGSIATTLPKTQYKMTMLHPRSDTSTSHVIGESIWTWGVQKTIPGVGQDPIFTIWRWNDCCNW